MFDIQWGPSLLGALAGGLAVVVLFFVARKKRLVIGEGSKMGINLAADLKCPDCQTPVPAIRRPKNMRQVLWGGWTCSNCGKEFDKWLKPVDPK